jgi:hypothetical protein
MLCHDCLLLPGNTRHAASKRENKVSQFLSPLWNKVLNAASAALFTAYPHPELRPLPEKVHGERNSWDKTKPPAASGGNAGSLHPCYEENSVLEKKRDLAQFLH